MLATLPMYDLPEIKAATDNLWQALGKRLGSDIRLNREINLVDAWRQPDLLFSQTCGFPLTHEFRGVLKYVATPHYAADGCHGAYYSSLLFARESQPLEKFRNMRAAVNTADSMSGMLALKVMVAPFASNRRFFSKSILTGSHMNSLRWVREDKADICAIDAVTAAHIRQHRPDLLQDLAVVEQSPMVPALPFVSRCGDINLIQQVLQDVIADDTLRATREALLLTGMSVLPADAYAVIASHERRMQGSGGVDLFT